jgi:Ankyrin repeats (many copies)
MTQDQNTSAASDALLARYHAAQAALDAPEASGPSAQTRTTILNYAAELATNSVAAPAIKQGSNSLKDTEKPAANDSQWKIRALATVAMFGLTSLLLLQWDRGTPQEKEVAFSTAPPPVAARSESAAAPAPAAAPVAPGPAKTEMPVDAAVTSKDAAKSKPAQLPDRQNTAPRPAVPVRDDKTSAPEAASSKPPNEQGAMAQAIAPPAAVPAPVLGAAPAPAEPAMRAAPAAKAAEHGAAQSVRREDAPNAASPPNAALFAAIRSGDAAAVQQALANGADKNAKMSGTPAITLCVQSGKLDLVQLLAAAGADVNAPDAQGTTPLAHARARGFDAIANALMGLGAN